MSGALAIPASQIVDVVPSVLAAGGTGELLSGLFLDDASVGGAGAMALLPVGVVLPFPTQLSVAAYFGASSQEAALATNYFSGYDNSTQKPAQMLFVYYGGSNPTTGWLRSGSLANTSLQTLQGYSGTVSVNIDGEQYTTGTINLSGAASFSAAAELISAALTVAGYSGPNSGAFTGSISGTTLTVSTVSSGALAVGFEVKGSNVAAGTVITAQLTGTSGGIGTYSLNNTQNVTSEDMTCNYPSVFYGSDPYPCFYIRGTIQGSTGFVLFASGTLATPLLLTQAAGAIATVGYAAQTPEAFMDSVIEQTQNWATFTTTFDPDNGEGNTNKFAFAAWVNGESDEYAYVAWDTDVTPTESTAATESLGYILTQDDSSGTIPIWAPSDTVGATKAAFVMGAIASINFGQTNGRITLAFRSQTGLAADVTSPTVAQNLLANGYNFYGTYSTANENFTWFYNGSITGPYDWADSYVNQIWLNNQLQVALMLLLQTVGSIPYNSAGYELIRAACQDPINAALNFGAIRAGVTLSQAQIDEINSVAGASVATILQAQGYYLQVLDPGPTVRQARGTPIINLWYCDGESVQKISLASVLVQ